LRDAELHRAAPAAARSRCGARKLGAAIQLFAFGTPRGAFVGVGLLHRSMQMMSYTPNQDYPSSAGGWSTRVEIGYLLRARNGLFGAIAAGVTHDWLDMNRERSP
jgi:hypothetical protein